VRRQAWPCREPARGVLATGLLAGLLAFASGPAAGHGGLAMEEDYCKLRIGRFVMHFSGYQPDSPNATKEFCEDIPVTGNTVIVLDYVDQELRDLETEVRVVKGTGEESDLDAVTVVHLAPRRYPTGTLSFEHDFAEAGNYVGLVTVSGQTRAVSRFPFAVGRGGGFGKWLLLGVAVAAAVVGLALVARHQRARALRRR
jgi:hypothetical protein